MGVDKPSVDPAGGDRVHSDRTEAQEVGPLLTLTAAPHRIEPGDVLTDLTRVGLALIEVPSPDRLTELMHALGSTIVPHRDSRPDGVTVIEDRGACVAALAGFTREAPTPHTDRSGIADPPDLLMTICANEPSTGGELLLVDGRAVYLDLAQESPNALAALSAPRSVLFGGADGYLGSVFTAHGGSVAVRFRLDALVRFSPAVGPHLATLRAAIDRHTITVPSRAGTGYVLDNGRWLHGRRSFTGDRLMYRVTASARPGTIRGGFTTSAAGDATALRGAS